MQLRFRYSTDPSVEGSDPTAPPGLFVDEIALTAGESTVFTDGAETLDDAWKVGGWERAQTTGQTLPYENYYIAGYRSYVSYDKYLQTGPYNFGWASTKPDLAEHFPYQEGLLVSYWDLSQEDNNVSEHPGEGRNLYVDAHPAPLMRNDGQPWRARVQLYDAPFSKKKADSISLHWQGERNRLRGLPGNPVFDDTQNYFDPAQLDHGVKVRNAGVKIEVVKQKNTEMTVKVTTP